MTVEEVFFKNRDKTRYAPPIACSRSVSKSQFFFPAFPLCFHAVFAVRFLKRRAGRKYVSKKRISRAGRNGDQPQARAADCSIFPAHDDFLFLRRNDYWIIRYAGHTAFLKSTRGLHYLAVLLSNSGREFHVRELLARATGASTLSATGAMHGNGTGEPYLERNARSETFAVSLIPTEYRRGGSNSARPIVRDRGLRLIRSLLKNTLRNS